MKSVRSVHNFDALAIMCDTFQGRLSHFCTADLSRGRVDGAAMMRH